MASVLVVDDDLWVLRMIATVLERRGHTVTQASDGEEALTKAAGALPDLIVTDINMPRMDGWELIAAMRASDDLKNVPVIILSELADDDSRVDGFRLGVEDYLAKPFRFEELDLRVERILRRARGEKNKARPETDSGLGPDVGLVGTLEQVGLSSLLTLLELDRKTGVLTLIRESDSAEAHISIVRGRCHAAEIVGRDSPVDAECIYELLTWLEGRFEFNKRSITTPDQIGLSTTGLLMEAARIADEANR